MDQSWQLSRINWSCCSAQHSRGGARKKQSAQRHSFIIAAQQTACTHTHPVMHQYGKCNNGEPPATKSCAVEGFLAGKKTVVLFENALPLCRRILILSPTLTWPDAILPVATRPKKESLSVMVTSMEKWPLGLPGGGGTCSSIASKSGSMLGFSGACPTHRS